MKIKDILELTQTKKVAEIAKEFLEVGEKKAVEGLKKAGCYNTSGKAGWYLGEGTDENVLEKSLYDFVAPTKRKSKAGKQDASIDKSVNESNNKSVNNSSNDSKKLVKNELLASEKESASTVEIESESKNASTNKSKKKRLDAIDKLLLENEDDSNKRVYRGFYWDKDIIDFVDNIKHGNKSDLLNEIVRAVLKSKGLLK